MRERINSALKTAMRDKEPLRICTLRLIIAAMQEKEISARGGDEASALGDEDMLDVLAKMVKQREESAKTYEDAGRPDLAKQEKAELRIIREFLPRPLPPEEVEAAVTTVIKETEASSIKDTGKVMSILKARYRGRMDFGEAGAAVRRALA